MGHISGLKQLLRNDEIKTYPVFEKRNKANIPLNLELLPYYPIITILPS